MEKEKHDCNLWLQSFHLKGRANRTLKMLADELVILDIVDNISAPTVCRALKKTNFNLYYRKCWVIPPEGNAEFVAAMEDVLDVYKKPYKPEIPFGLYG